MCTALSLIYYFVTALAELRHTWRSARGWALIALVACAYSLFTMFGSGLEILAWGFGLVLAGLPLFYLFRRQRAIAVSAL